MKCSGSTLLAVLLILLMCFSQDQSLGASKADSLQNVLEKTQNKKEKVDILNALCKLNASGDPQKAFDYGERSLKLAEKIGYTTGFATAYKHTGIVYYAREDYPEALDRWLRALDQFKEADDQKQTANMYNNIGVIFYRKGVHDEALKFYLKTLPLFEKLNNLKGLAAIYNNIGKIYEVQGHYEKALDYYRNSLKIKKQLGDQGGRATTFNNIGNIYHQKGNEEREKGNIVEAQELTRKALEYYHKSMELGRDLDNKRYIARAYQNIGLVYSERGDLEKGLKNQQKSLELKKETGDKTGLIYAYLGIGEIYQKQKNWSRSILYYNKGKDLAMELDTRRELKNAYEGLSEVYRETGDFKKAARIQSNLLNLKDSLFNREKAEQIHRLELKEKRRQAQKRERLERIREKRRNRIQYSGILIFLVFIFVGVFFTGRFTFRKRFAEGLIFIAFILLFEFILVLLDPKIDQYSGGEPAWKLVANAILALFIFPVHSFFEEKLKKRVVKEKSGY